MKRSTNSRRHRPEEVVTKLGQADEALAKGTPIGEVARSLWVSEVTLHRWRAEYGAVDRDVVRRMKELEKENARLKRLVAEKELDILILREVAKGNPERRVFVWAAAPGDRRVTDVLPISERQACRVIGQHRSTQRCTAPPDPHRDKLVAWMRELAVANLRSRRRHIMDLLHKERLSVGVRLMKRLWRREGLLVPQKRVKRRRIGTDEDGIKRRRASIKNDVWGMDFVQDRTADGRPFRMLVVLDEYTRECLAIDRARNFRDEDIVAVMDELTAIRGAPGHSGPTTGGR
jgi:DNA-binding transcriptional MerR regulator